MRGREKNKRWTEERNEKTKGERMRKGDKKREGKRGNTAQCKFHRCTVILPTTTIMLIIRIRTVTVCVEQDQGGSRWSAHTDPDSNTPEAETSAGPERGEKAQTYDREEERGAQCIMGNVMSKLSHRPFK